MRKRVSILGTPIDCFESYEQFYEDVKCTLIDYSAAGYVTVNNVHTVIEGFWDDGYREASIQACRSIPDGNPLAVVSRIKGVSKTSRLFGPTTMENFIDWGRKDGLKHFFIGGSQQTLNRLEKRLKENYDGVQIAGMISPPFGDVSSWDNEGFLAQINASDADLIWVGLGAPKQELWMKAHCGQLKKGIMFGIGAGFSYMAGDLKHAPDWVKKNSLEWVFRLVQEPRRLWKRYLKTIPLFIILISWELLRNKISLHRR